MMFNVVESGKAQKLMPILSFCEIRLHVEFMNNLVTKSTTEGQAAYMLYNVVASGIRSFLT